MQFKQARRILTEIARDGRASGRVRLKAIELLSDGLPRLGGYASGSVKNLLWRLTSNGRARPLQRLRALQELISKPKENAMKPTPNAVTTTSDKDEAMLHELFELATSEPHGLGSYSLRKTFCEKHDISQDHPVFAECSALIWDMEFDAAVGPDIAYCVSRVERLIAMYERGGAWTREKVDAVFDRVSESQLSEHELAKQKIREFRNSRAPDEK